MSILSIAPKLVRSWLIQGIGIYAITEIIARFLLEGGFCLILGFLGVPLAMIVVGWIPFHTAAWLLLYSGFSRTWVFLNRSTDVARIRAYLDHLTSHVRGRSLYRAVYLRGSAARDAISPTSDIDIWVVPNRAPLVGVLVLWFLRAESVLHRVPLEADWLDCERYVPFIARGKPLRNLTNGRPRDRAEAMVTGGLLVSVSGIDGSGKTTVAKQLVSSLTLQGFDAVYFSGGRPREDLRDAGSRLSLEGGFEFVWRRMGRTTQEFERHRLAKALFDASTFLDYVGVLWRLSLVRAPNRIVVADEYVADVLAHLRTMGPGRSFEGFLAGVAFGSDLAILLDVPPPLAAARTREQSVETIEKRARAFAELRALLGLTAVDGAEAVPEVHAHAWRLLQETLPAVPLSRKLTSQLNETRRHSS